MSSVYRPRLSARIVGVPDGEPISGINTTPLIDVMLVLLIMFIITIPMRNDEVPMTLPQPGPVAVGSQMPHLLAIARNGAVTLDGVAVDASALRDRLSSLRNDPRNEIQIKTDPATRYEVVVDTLAVVKRAGITRLGFVGNAPLG
jgi:biopolymer transport protein ExbD